MHSKTVHVYKKEEDAAKLKNLTSILLLILVIFLLFVYGESHRVWFLHVDQEFTLAYNALLSNSHLKQEYLDHPGFFTIQFLSNVIQLKFLMGMSGIQNLNDLNNYRPLVLGFSDIVQSAHILAFVTVSILIVASYLFAKSILRDNISSILLALLVLFDGAIIANQFVQLRTELIACLFLYLALYIAFRSVASDSLLGFFRLYLVLALGFCASLNKVQVILFVPLYFLWAIYYYVKPNSLSRIKFDKKSQLIFSILSIISCYTFFIVLSKGLSIGFNILYLTSLNALIWFYWYKAGGNLAKRLMALNIAYLASYISVRLVVYFWVGHSAELFSQINNPMDMLYWANSLNTQAFNKSGIHWDELSTQFNFYKLAEIFVGLVITPARLILSHINSQSILFYLNLALFLAIKNQPTSNKINLLICLISFYLVLTVSSFRYLAGQYYIFSEFFLIAALIPQIAALKFRRIICLFLVLVFLGINYTQITTSLADEGINIEALCSGTYMEDWHRQIDLKPFYIECGK